MGKETERACWEVAQTCLAFNLRRATRQITRIYDEALKPSGLKVTQFTLLVAVNLGGSVPMQRLAAVLGMDRTTLTRNLKGLEELGLVEVSAGEDRRSRLVSLTGRGSQALEAALPHWRRVQAESLQILGPRTVTALMPALAGVSELPGAFAAAGSVRPPSALTRSGSQPSALTRSGPPEEKGESHGG